MEIPRWHYPTIRELEGYGKNNLRPVITNGGYKDNETYADIYYKLTREDFCSQVRRGIKERVTNTCLRLRTASPNINALWLSIVSSYFKLKDTTKTTLYQRLWFKTPEKQYQQEFYKQPHERRRNFEIEIVEEVKFGHQVAEHTGVSWQVYFDKSKVIVSRLSKSNL